jgi:hypothetical protein
MTTKEVIKKYFGSNVFSKELIDEFEIKQKSISDYDKAKNFINELKTNGFEVRKKSYSDFTAIMGVKKRT